MDGRIGVNMSKQTVSNVSKQDEISEIGLSNLTRGLEQIIQIQKKDSCLEHIQTQCTRLADGLRWPRCVSLIGPMARPWRLAELKTLPSESQAATKAWQVSRQSGFRARLTAMRREMEEADMLPCCHAAMANENPWKIPRNLSKGTL